MLRPSDPGSLCRVFVVFGLLAVAQGAAGSEAATRCAAIEPPDARLACYDALFGRAAAITDGPAPEAVAIAAEMSRGDEAAESQSEITVVPRRRSDLFAIVPHHTNYLLPATWNESADYSAFSELGDNFSDTEVKFQVSLKTPLWRRGLWRDSSLWFGYTQLSFWQLWAEAEASAPFRETNYEPELMWSVPVDVRVLGMDVRTFTLSFAHQSNGRAQPLSRSWNRVYGRVDLERGNFSASATFWTRVDDPEPRFDDNPDIEDFMGRARLRLAWSRGRHRVALDVRNNLDTDNRSGVELDWFFPIFEHVDGFVQFYSGYGENLIDMENQVNRVGIGFAVSDGR